MFDALPNEPNIQFNTSYNKPREFKYAVIKNRLTTFKLTMDENHFLQFLFDWHILHTNYRNYGDLIDEATNFMTQFR